MAEEDECGTFAFGCKFEAAIINTIDGWAESFGEAAENVIKESLDLWVTDDSNPLEESSQEDNLQGDATPPAAEGQIAELLGYMTWIGLATSVLALIILGGILGMARSRGEGGQNLSRIGVVLGSVILIGGATALVSGLLGNMDSSSAGGAVGFLQSSLFFYVMAAASASVIFAGIKMAWEQRADPGKDLLKSFLTLVVVATSAVTFINLAIQMGDDFAQWILGQALGQSEGSLGDMPTMFTETMGVDGLAAAPGGFLVVLLMALFIVIVSIIQMLIMIVRDGMLILLTGVLPLTASFTNTQMGKQWFQKALGWLLAFLLYKPVAAIVYSLVFVLLSGSEEDQFRSILTGLTMMLVAIFALPALMKFVTPMVGATADGAMGGGSMPSMPSGSGSSSGGGGSGGGGGGSGGSPTGNNGSGQQSSSGGPPPGGSAGGGAGGGAAGGGGTAAAGGGAAGGGAAASGAGSAAMKSNPKTAAVYAALKASKEGINKAQQGLNDAAGGDEGGPSGSKR